METEAIHRATSEDGTAIAGRVHGHGPPLVLVHGALADGETAWVPLLPHLTEHFTCYTMSLRGRGLSEPNDDLQRDRAIQDVVAFVESIGERVAVMGLSSGALWSLGAAERSDAVAAVAAYEPPVMEVMDEDISTRFMQTVTAVTEAAEEGRLVDGVRTFLQFVSNDEELETLERLGFVEALAPNLPVQADEFSQLFASPGDGPTTSTELEKIEVPVFLPHGTRSVPGDWFPTGVRRVQAHVENTVLCEIDGAGHLAPICRPEAVAPEVTTFFASAWKPV